MTGDSLCLHKIYLPLHFGQTTAKSAGVSSEMYSSGISSDSFFASRLTANAIFFAVQFGLGQSKEGSRRRSSAMVFFNFCLCPPRSMFMKRAFYDPLNLQLVHDDVRIHFGIRIAGMKNKLFHLLILPLHLSPPSSPSYLSAS